MGYNLKIAVHWWWWWRRRGGIDICLREIKIWWSGEGGGARGRSLLGLEIFLDGMEGEMSRESFDYLIKTLIINLKEFTVNSINCIVWESNLPLEHKIHVYTVSKGINQ